MAKTKISEFSATPGNNTDIDSINIAEGCAPSGINDAIRELMAQLKDFQTGAVGDSFNGPVGTTTAAAGAFTTLAASGAVTLSGGTANGVTYLNGSKVLTSGSALVFDGTNLGIGTSSPSYKLDVKSADGIRLRDADDLRFLRLIPANGTGDVPAQIDSSSSLGLAINVAGSRRLLVDGSGNLGLGVTPSAWNATNIKALQISNGGFANNGGSGFITNNAFYTGGYVPTYIATGPTQMISFNRAGGNDIQFLVAPSGTAGNAITFTQAMTLDASGNLLVGTTSSIVNSNARLHVVGTEGIRGQATASGGTASIGAFGTSTGATYYYIGYDMTAGSIKYQVLFNGNVQNTNNSYGAISDIKLKENIVDASPKLVNLMQVKVRNYNLIGDTTKQIGVVAQELETVFPSMIEETVDYDLEGNDLGTTTKAVKYSVFVPMLIKAMQEQQALIQSLQEDVAALKAAA